MRYTSDGEVLPESVQQAISLLLKHFTAEIVPPAVIGEWADYCSLYWSREEGRLLLCEIFPPWVIEYAKREPTAYGCLESGRTF